MNHHVEELIEALRLELQQYGELLALLEAEPARTAPAADVTGVVAVLSTLRRQGAELGAARRQRMLIQARFASAVDRPPEESLISLLPEFPVDYRPLLRALGDEIEDLLARLRERARLSHTHLHAAADQLEGFIGTVAASPNEDRPVPQSLHA